MTQVPMNVFPTVASRPSGALLPPIDWTLNERVCWVPVFDDLQLANAHLDGLVLSVSPEMQERANDDRARAWLAQLPAAN